MSLLHFTTGGPDEIFTEDLLPEVYSEAMMSIKQKINFIFFQGIRWPTEILRSVPCRAKGTIREGIPRMAHRFE